MSAICVPLSQMLIRAYLSREFGLAYAGYWEAMIRLSTVYLMLVTTILGVYYLPRLSELKMLDEIKKEIYLGYKFLFPLAVAGGIIVLCYAIGLSTYCSVLFRTHAKPVLLANDGRCIKIGSWILAYLMLSKAMTKLYISTEIIFTVSLLVLTYVCTQVLDLKVFRLLTW